MCNKVVVKGSLLDKMINQIPRTRTYKEFMDIVLYAHEHNGKFIGSERTPKGTGKIAKFQFKSGSAVAFFVSRADIRLPYEVNINGHLCEVFI
jgi:hypothetical protein